MDVLQSDMLQLPFDSDWVFFDKDYVVTRWNLMELKGKSRCVFRTYSIHPPKSGGKTMDLRLVASFQIPFPRSVDYKDGILVFTPSCGEIT